ncbi:MAG: DNA mismatch repair protein MutS [Deltaproteobacteria bacterium]|nr:DNA mismatch repair protein MutS [Deltaproteobacteria bacterium]
MAAADETTGAYEKLRAEHQARAADEEKRSRWLSVLRGVSFVAAVALAVEAAWWRASGHAALTGGAAAACVIAFFVLVVVHARVIARRERALAGARACNDGLTRVAGRLSELPPRGASFASEAHPYSDDLDLFGGASVFQLFDRTTTAMGERRLASWLLAAAPPDVVRARQEAVKELSPRLAWRIELMLDGMSVDEADRRETSAARADVERLVRWAGSPRPTWAAPGLAVLAWVLPVATAGLAIASPIVGFPAWSVTVTAALTFATSLAYAKRLADTIETASGLRDALERFGAVLARIEQAEMKAGLLAARKEAMRDPEGRGPAAQVRELASIVGFLDARRNDIFRLVIGPLLMWDVHWCLALDRWRGRSGARVSVWLETVAEVEALASLAGVAFDHPRWCFAEIGSGNEARFAAEGLAHPLIAASTAVANDVELPQGALLVTGSNMSGKSTMLRSIGLAAVMAQAGGPSCATRLVMTPLDVRTSMRVRDSVEEGVSRFYAEVLKLRRVIDGTDRPAEGAESGSGRVAPNPRVLFLLDEILSGTNSAERHAGARAIVRELIERGAIGAVSTHDLALAALVDELPRQTRLVHFEEQVTADEMTFDYRLRDGIVRTRNALRLMRRAGLPVPAEEPVAHDA